MIPLSDDDIRRVLEPLPEPIAAFVASHRVVLAGGFVRDALNGETPKDIDLFPVGDEESPYAMADRFYDAMRLLPDAIATDRPARWHTDNAVTFRAIPGCPYPVQVITRWSFVSPEAVLEHFDFTIARAAIWMASNGQWTGLIDPRFGDDISEKRLVYTGSDEPGASLLRAFKFARRGYHMPLASLAHLVRDVADQVSTAYPVRSLDEAILEGLRRVDPGPDEWDGDDA